MIYDKLKYGNVDENLYFFSSGSMVYCEKPILGNIYI